MPLWPRERNSSRLSLADAHRDAFPIHTVKIVVREFMILATTSTNQTSQYRQRYLTRTHASETNGLETSLNLMIKIGGRDRAVREKDER